MGRPGIWAPLILVVAGLGLFAAAVLGKLPWVVGGIGGFLGGLGVLLPLDCVTQVHPVERTVCHSAVGIPISERWGMVGGVTLGVLLVGLVIGLPDRRTEG